MARGATTGGWTRATVVGLVLVLAAACSDGEGPGITYGEVTSGEVVETVAAPATIQPAGQATVVAPASGEVAELAVADGDRVERGEMLVRLTSGSVVQRIAQAEAAVAAADGLSEVSAGADLSPVLEAVGAQLDAVLPELLDGLRAEARQLGEPALRQEAMQRLAAAREDYREVRGALDEAERELAASAAAATTSQREAADARREQAELALESAQRQAEELTVTAPTSGVVELVRDGGGTSDGGIPDLGGALSGGGGGQGSPGEALPGLSGAVPGGSRSGPVAEGVEVSAGEALVRVLDLSGFHAQAQVDEIDAVQVSEGQPVTVLVDAHPGLELSGTVAHVALSPGQGATGGVVYPTVVALDEVPSDVRLLAGLTASVEIEVRRVDADTVVPSAALRRIEGRDVVRVDRGEEVVTVPVDVAAVGAETAAVEPREGTLAPGDRVVVAGLDVTDGDTGA